MSSQFIHFGTGSLPEPQEVSDDISRYKLEGTSKVALNLIVPKKGYNSRLLIAWRVEHFVSLFKSRIEMDAPFFDDSHVFHVICSSEKLEYFTCDVQHRLEAARQLAKLGLIDEDHKFTVWP